MKVPETDDNKTKCICPKCPTFDDCAKEKGEILYCAVGKSDCDLVEAGCICGKCPVFQDYKLNKYYFCLEGKAQ